MALGVWASSWIRQLFVIVIIFECVETNWSITGSDQGFGVRTQNGRQELETRPDDSDHQPHWWKACCGKQSSETKPVCECLRDNRKSHGDWDSHWRDREVCSSGSLITHKRCFFTMASTFCHATSWRHLVWTRFWMPVTHLPFHWRMGFFKRDFFVLVAKQLLFQSLNLLPVVALCPLLLSLPPSCPGISTLIAKGVYDAAFPLHDVSMTFWQQQEILAIYSIISTNCKNGRRKKRRNVCWCTLPKATIWFTVVEICKFNCEVSHKKCLNIEENNPPSFENKCRHEHF